jgi:uncharacterized protein with HEPN domain
MEFTITVGSNEADHERQRKEFDEIMRLQGKMLLSWAQLDTLLSRVLGQLAETDEETAKVIYYTPSAFSGRLEILANLAKHLMPEMNEKRDLLKLFEKIHNLHKTRNSITHSYLALDLDMTRDQSVWMRRETRPSTKELDRSFKAQASTIAHHLELLGNVHQYLHALGAWTFPRSRSDVERWANITLYSSKQTSS